MSAATDLVRSFYAAIESGQHAEQLGTLLTEDVRTVERPNALVPTGRVSDRATMLANSTAGVGLLASQRYEVHSLAEADGTVAARLTWVGVIAQDAGPFVAAND